MLEHQPGCPKLQAWDMGEMVPCLCDYQEQIEMPDAEQHRQEPGEALRRVVLEEWCGKCQCPIEGPHHWDNDGPKAKACDEPPTDPLWTRWPELRPEGLTMGRGSWFGDWANVAGQDFPLSVAHALICWPMARELAKASTGPIDDTDLAVAEASDNPVQQLAALCHRLKDEQENKT